HGQLMRPTTSSQPSRRLSERRCRGLWRGRLTLACGARTIRGARIFRINRKIQGRVGGRVLRRLRTSLGFLVLREVSLHVRAELSAESLRLLPLAMGPL